MRKPKIRSITIIGRRWFDRRFGNTYNTAQVIINGKTAFMTEFQYGYDRHYETIASDELEKHGYLTLEKYSNGNSECLWQYCDRNKIAFLSLAFDVATQREAKRA